MDDIEDVPWHKTRRCGLRRSIAFKFGIGKKEKEKKFSGGGLSKFCIFYFIFGVFLVGFTVIFQMNLWLLLAFSIYSSAVWLGVGSFFFDSQQPPLDVSNTFCVCRQLETFWARVVYYELRNGFYRVHMGKKKKKYRLVELWVWPSSKKSPDITL